MDVPLLIYGLLRVLVWAYGAWDGYRRRSIIQVLGCACATLTSCTLALISADVEVPQPLADLVPVVATPIAVLIVAALVFAPVRARRDGWGF